MHFNEFQRYFSVSYKHRQQAPDRLDKLMVKIQRCPDNIELRTELAECMIPGTLFAIRKALIYIDPNRLDDLIGHFLLRSVIWSHIYDPSRSKPTTFWLQCASREWLYVDHNIPYSSMYPSRNINSLLNILRFKSPGYIGLSAEHTTAKEAIAVISGVTGSASFTVLNALADVFTKETASASRMTDDQLNSECRALAYADPKTLEDRDTCRVVIRILMGALYRRVKIPEYRMTYTRQLKGMLSGKRGATLAAEDGVSRQAVEQRTVKAIHHMYAGLTEYDLAWLHDELGWDMTQEGLFVENMRYMLINMATGSGGLPMDLLDEAFAEADRRHPATRKNKRKSLKV